MMKREEKYTSGVKTLLESLSFLYIMALKQCGCDFEKME
jgi:hypothetical protein